MAGGGIGEGTGDGARGSAGDVAAFIGDSARGNGFPETGDALMLRDGGDGFLEKGDLFKLRDGGDGFLEKGDLFKLRDGGDGFLEKGDLFKLLDSFDDRGRRIIDLLPAYDGYKILSISSPTSIISFFV